MIVKLILFKFSLQVLFRSGVLSQLEGKRDELLTDRIIQLQAYCRGFLARRRTAQTRVQVIFFFLIFQKFFLNRKFFFRIWLSVAFKETLKLFYQFVIGNGGDFLLEFVHY